MDDKMIIALLSERDERAVIEIQQKYREYCLFIARNILENEEDAKECLNATLLGVWNSVPPNNPKGLRTYIGAVCRRTALKQIEKRMAEKRGGGRGEVALEELEEVLKCDPNSVDEIALRDMLQRFLRSLSKKSRIVFIQKYWYFQTIEEIAKDLGMSTDSVKSSLYRSREKLRKFMCKEGFEI